MYPRADRLASPQPVRQAVRELAPELVAAAIASRAPEEELGYLPVLFLFWLAFDLVGLAGQKAYGGWIGHGAHLGGALAGLLLGHCLTLRTQRNSPV